MSDSNLEDIKERHEKRLMKIDNVVGVGLGQENGRPNLMVFVEKATSKTMQAIPARLEGYEVKVKEVGKLVAFCKRREL